MSEVPELSDKPESNRLNAKKIMENLNSAAHVAVDKTKTFYHETVEPKLQDLKEKRDYNKAVTELDKKHSQINEPVLNALRGSNATLSHIDNNLTEMNQRDRTTLLGSLFRGTANIIALPVKAISLTAVIAAGTSIAHYATDENKDIMDIPDDISAWLEKHPEIGEKTSEIMGPYAECAERPEILSSATCVTGTFLDEAGTALSKLSEPTESALPKYPSAPLINDPAL